jgi:hypothetical protein
MTLKLATAERSQAQAGAAEAVGELEQVALGVRAIRAKRLVTLVVQAYRCWAFRVAVQTMTNVA